MGKAIRKYVSKQRRGDRGAAFSSAVMVICATAVSVALAVSMGVGDWFFSQVEWALPGGAQQAQQARHAQPGTGVTADAGSALIQETGFSPLARLVGGGSSSNGAGKAESGSTQADAGSAAGSNGQASSASSAPSGGKAQDASASGNESTDASTQGSASSSSGNSAAASSSSSASGENGSAQAEQATPAEEDEQPKAEDTKTIKKQVKFANGKKYTVEVEYGADAQIPDGAELQVVQVIQKPSDEDLKKEENKNRPYDTEKFEGKAGMEKRLAAAKKALDVKDEDHVFFAEYLDVSIMADGKEVQPKAAVKVTVSTDAISARQAPSIEAAALKYDKDKKEFDGTQLKAENESAKKKGAKVSFEADGLPELALVGVATPIVKDELHGQQVEVLGPRGLEDFEPRAVEPQGLTDDQELQTAYWVSVTPDYDYHTALWARVKASEGTEADEADKAGTLEVYRLADDGTVAERLAGQSDQGQAAEMESGDAIAVVWEKSFRDTKLDLGEVTLEGAMPVDASGEAKDVAGEYADPAAVVDAAPQVVQAAAVGAADGDENEDEDAQAADADAPDAQAAGTDAGAADDEPADAAGETPAADAPTPVEVATAAADAASEQGAAKVETIAAYDISIQAAGESYQPGDARPVTVTISNDAITADKNLQVWHVLDDGTVEVIDDFAVEDGSITFEATGFSTYMVVYTVDFHWGDYTYNLEGGSTIFLSELLRILADGAAGAPGGDAGAYDAATLQRLLDDPSLVENVEFSDPELVQVDEVVIVGDDGEGDGPEEDEGKGDEDIETADAKTDWRLWSLAPFDTDETLAITLTSGEKVEIPVTDINYGENGEAVMRVGNARVTADGVTYNLANDGVSDGWARVYAYSNGCMIHDKISYKGKTYTVQWANTGVGYANFTKFSSIRMDADLIKRAAGYSFDLPELRSDLPQSSSDSAKDAAGAEEQPTPLAKDWLANNGFVAGANNDDSDNKVWKKAEYNPAANSIDYTMKYFQAMKEDVPLDFIFIYDDSISMFDGNRWAPSNADRQVRIVEAQGTRVIILEAAKALLSDAAKDNYDIRVAVGGAANGDTGHSGWFTSKEGLKDVDGGYNELENYLATYHGGPRANTGGVTDHEVGTNNAYAMAKASHEAGRTPIVIYLSDFVDGGGTAVFRNKITPLMNQVHGWGSVYGLKTIGTGGNFRTQAITSGDDYLYFMGDEFPEGVKQLEAIIKDAIGYYMKDEVTVTDNLSDALKALTPGDAAKDEGSVTQSKGKSTWTLGGTKDSAGSYPGAGAVYEEAFSVKLDDNKVYAGDIRTNGAATVSVNGKNTNGITPDEDNPDELRVAKAVTFLLGKLDDHDEYENQIDGYGAPKDENRIPGIGFTLQEADKSLFGNNYTAKADATAYTYTTDSDGALVVPYKEGNNVVLQNGHYYLLTEGSVDSYASPKLKRPDKSWVVSVDQYGVVTVKPQNGAGQTPEATIARADGTNPARYVLWNQIVVEAQLIPITVQKKWDASQTEHRDPVPITIYGVYQQSINDHEAGDREELQVYDGPDAETATRVGYLTADNDNLDNDPDTWTQTVYVLEWVDEQDRFFTYQVKNAGELDDNHTYKVGDASYTKAELLEAYGEDINDDGIKDRIRYEQTYSYAIEEGDLVYDDGWYTPSYGNNASGGAPNTLTSGTVDTWTKKRDPVPDAWETYGDDAGETTSTAFQIHYNSSGVTYRDYGYNSHGSFFQAITSIDIEVKSNNASDTIEKFRSTITPATWTQNSPGPGVIFYGIALPQEWVGHGLRESKYGTIKDLEITRFVIHLANGKIVNIVKDGSTIGTYGPNYNSYLLGLYVEKYDPSVEYNWVSHSPNGLVGNGRAQIPDTGEDPKQIDGASFPINSCTLPISNTWNPNTLIPITVTKNWVNSEGAEGADVMAEQRELDANKSVSFSVTGSSSANTKKVPVFESQDAAWSTGATDPTITGATTDTTWTKTVYVPQFDTSTYNRDSEPNPCEEYVYGADAVTEDSTLTVSTDADGEKKGVWADPAYTAGKIDSWARYDYTKRAYLKVTRAQSSRTYNSADDVNLYYVSESGHAYHTTATGLTKLTNMSGDPSLMSDATFYIEVQIPRNEDIEKLWLVESGLIANDANKSWQNKTLYNGTNHGYVKFAYDDSNDIVKLDTIGATSTTGQYGIRIGSQDPSFQQVNSWSTWSPSDGNPALDEVKFISSVPSGVPAQNIIENERSSVEKYVASTFTLTNTFTPYKKVDLTSVFTDSSADKDSTKTIGKVAYTITGAGDDNADYSRTVVTDYDAANNKPAVRQDGDSVVLTTSKSVYIPKGEYKIEQTAYTIGDESRRYETVAYTTDAKIKVGDAAEQTKAGATELNGPADGASITKDATVTFDNSRKELNIAVQTEFDPEVTDADAANVDSRPLADRTLAYTLSYKKEGQTDPVTLSGDGYALADGDFVYGGGQESDNAYKNYRRTHTTEKIPSYSVRTEMTECAISGENAETALPDYKTYVFGEEKPVNGTDMLVFTIAASINRAPVIVSKSWDEEMTRADREGVELSFEIRRVDKDGNPQPIYGEDDTNPVGLSRKTDAEGNAFGTFTLGKDEEQTDIYLPALRKNEIAAGVRYVLAEKSAKQGEESRSYYVNFTDTAASAENMLEQTNPGGKNIEDGSKPANEAKFVLTSGGIVIDANNANSPYICKIVETFGDEGNISTVEVPFRKLNKAVDHAREYGNGREMSADNPVKIEMLVDYVIPDGDKVALDKATDNIVITTAATSGGVYNFVPTFGEEDGREPWVETKATDDKGAETTTTSGDSREVAILQRGWDGGTAAGNSLFYISNASAKLTTQDITLDGKSRAANESEPKQKTGRVIYVNAGTGLSIEGGTTIRNFNTKNNGGAIYLAKGGKFINNSTDKDVLFRNCFIDNTSSSNGGAVYSASGDVVINNIGAGTVMFDTCYNTGDSGDDGGAVDVEGSYNITLNNTSSGTIRFQDCHANYGGAMCTDSGVVTINNSGTGTIEILRCYNHNAHAGGAIYSGNGFMVENSGTICFDNTGIDASKNKTADGGAVYSKDYANITSTGSGRVMFKNYTAKNGSGGAVYASGAVNITGTASFTSCTANGSGGAVYSSKAVTLINSGTITEFKDCTAKTGGAIYASAVTLNNNNAVNEGVTSEGKITVTGCKATGEHGGGIRTNGAITFNNNQGVIEFIGCEATGCGGGIEANGSRGNIYMNSNSGTIRFKDCVTNYSSYGGGGAYTDGLFEAKENTGTISFENCSADNNYGGGLDARGTVTIESSGTGKAAFTGCHAKNGGGLYSKGNATITGATFGGCYAKENGGAMHLYAGGTLENVRINGAGVPSDKPANAQLGGAVHSGGNLTIKQSGTGTSEIKNCSAFGANGGAVNVASGKTMTFEGEVVVYNNVSNSQQKNVVLEQNSNGTINTSNIGLGENAHIGVYVTGSETADPYKTHGQYEQRFGTTANAETSAKNLNRFTNDRNGLYGEYIAPNGIRWQGYLCKLTDSRGKLLYIDAERKNPAVYNTLKEAFEAVSGARLWTEDDDSAYSASDAIKVEMLRNYVMPREDSTADNGGGVVNSAARAVTLTTAANTTNGADVYIYNKGSAADADNDYATIKRGYSGNSMFEQNAANNSLILERIILDGNKNADQDYASTAKGGIVNVASGTLNIGENATLQNSKAANGGAVYVAASANMVMSAGTITGNEATGDGAGIYLDQDSKLELSGTPDFGGVDANEGNRVDTGNAAFRQDIYIKGYTGTEADRATPKNATSLVVTGVLNLEKASIWVDAERVHDENNHYDSLKQFAKFADKLMKDGKPNLGDSLATTVEAFRNAYAPEYYGVTSEDNPQFIYWDGVHGSREVILRKVSAEGGGVYASLPDAEFTIYKGTASDAYKVKRGDSGPEELSGLSSGANGVFWVGELPYAVYVLHETAVPSGYAKASPYFYLVVDEDGVVASETGYGTQREAAEAGKAEQDQRKESRAA